MKIFSSVFNFYINSSIHVGLAVVALTWITLIQFNLGCDKTLLLFVFFATITGYNFIKYFGLAKFHHRRLANWLKAIQVFSAFAFVAMCFFGFQLSAKLLMLVGSLAVVTFLYAIPLLPKHYVLDEHQNLRAISGLKIYVIAFVWAVVTVVLPLLNSKYSINSDVGITVIQRFCLVFVLMLPFEIRDLNYDSVRLGTIPQKIGVKNTKICGVLFLIFILILEFFKNEFIAINMILTVLIVLSTTLFLLFSNKDQPKYYSAFWVESLPLVWLTILLMLS